MPFLLSKQLLFVKIKNTPGRRDDTAANAWRKQKKHATIYPATSRNFIKKKIVLTADPAKE